MAGWQVMETVWLKGQYMVLWLYNTYIVVRLDVDIGSEGWKKHETNVGNVEVPHSNSISCSNNSLLVCLPASQATQVRFPIVSRCSSWGWRWPLTSLFIEMTPTWFKNTLTCKYLIIPGKKLANSIRIREVKSLIPIKLHWRLHSRY
jgi:hypothetical protein